MDTIIFIVPFFWSVKYEYSFHGSLLINLDNRWQCSQIYGNLSWSDSSRLFFMLIYTWTCIGPYPCKQLKPVAIALGIYILSQVLVYNLWDCHLQLGLFRLPPKAPNLLYHVRFEIGTFWLAFSCFCAYGVRYVAGKIWKNRRKR